jgi:macrolide-specific efflux system membrane fusion protein
MNEKGLSRVAINLALVAVLIAIGVGAYLVIGGGGGETALGQTTTTTVSRGTVRSTVSASGTIQSAETAGASFATSGTVTEILVEVGDHVRAGEVLAQVDEASAQTDLESASANASSAAAGVTSAQAGVTSAQSGVTSAQASLSAAQENLRELRHSEEATDAQIADAESQVASAHSQLEQARASVTSASAQVAQAQASLTSANAGVAQAQDALTTPCFAPIATVVESAEPWARARHDGLRPSDTTSSTSSDTSGFVVISDMKDLQVSANFSETDTASIRVGQRATVTLNALPDVEIKGRVIAIDETSTTVNQVVNYGVTIQLQDVPRGVRVGQTVVAEVVTGRARDVLLVPSAAVTTAGGQSTVTVVQNAQQVSTPVEIGLEGDQFTEIVSACRGRRGRARHGHGRRGHRGLPRWRLPRRDRRRTGRGRPVSPDRQPPPGQIRPPVIDLEDVRKVYGAGDTAVHAVRGVTLRVEHGDYVAVMGASGSGKSTLMHIIGCLDVPTAGGYRLDGSTWATSTSRSWRWSATARWGSSSRRSTSCGGSARRTTWSCRWHTPVCRDPSGDGVRSPLSRSWVWPDTATGRRGRSLAGSSSASR